MNASESQKGSVQFNALAREAEIEASERYLPHWFQVGAATFVTFRTADSIPGEVIARWRQELAEWLRIQKLPMQLADFVLAHRTDDYYKLFEQLSTLQRRDYNGLSDRLFHRSLDECRGACVLRRSELAEIVGDAIRFYDAKKYDLDRFARDCSVPPRCRPGNC